MKNVRIVGMLVLFAALMMITSCSSTADDETSLGNWTKVTPFKGVKRSGSISFTIGTKVFVGLGYDGDDYLTDLYTFDVNNGYWESRKAFPAEFMPRERAVSFAVNGKGYVGLGYNRDQDEEELADFWEYDPDADEWTYIGDFGGTARYNAISFAIGSKGYVGTGYDGDNTNSDFWEFDPTTETKWKEIVSYPGEKIESGLAFVINNKAYIGTGRENGLPSTDFWEFTPGTGDGAATWVKRTPDDEESDYDEFKLAMFRYDAIAVTWGTKAYIVGGVASSGAADKGVYEFDATTFDWTDRTAFEGSARSLAVGFTLNDRIFVGTGQNGSSRYDDIWEFKPLEAEDEDN